MENVATGNACERISNALVILRSEMLELRQQDVQLMDQLLSINNNIKTLTRRRMNPNRQTKKKYSSVKGRRKFINLNESIPEEDSSSADSDSDVSISSNDNDM
ncbi:uncharacterized protein [Argopecten irradians]|uniref:uncharacterized protein n=1 Tax=Argopecten irradians TaxID=31199 RepID=UPI00371C5E31